MVTLAVAAILGMIAVPSLRHLLISSNLTDVNNGLVGDLQYARTEAVTRQTDIAVAASAGNWQNGWSVEVPAVGSTSAVVLRVHPAVPPQYVVGTGGITQVTYQPQGSLAPPSSAVATACFTISAAKGVNNPPHYLQVASAGLLQQSSGTTTPAGCTAPAP